MFVLPLSRSTRRVAAPQFSRVADQFFDESLSRFFGAAGNDVPALDVSETDTAYNVTFDVPGVTREQLKVSVDGRRVSVETVEPAKVAVTEGAEANGEAAAVPAAPRVLYRERTSARYARTVSLPAEVDQAASQAKFENGVLTLTLAKKVPAGAQQIRIS